MRCTDKRECLVFPPGTSHIETLRSSTPREVVDVVDVFYGEDEDGFGERIGKRRDNGRCVELFQNDEMQRQFYNGHEWYGIEIGDDEEPE